VPCQTEGPTPCPYDYEAILHSSRLVPLTKKVLLRLRAAGLITRWRGRSDLSPITGGWNHPRLPTGNSLCLNLGCGEANYTGFVNLDIVEHLHLHVRADGRHLPFAAQRFAQVLCTDVLEHLDAEDGKQLLQEVSRILQPDGRLILVTPDLDGIMLVHQVRAATHQQVMQHLYGDEKDHSYLYNKELLTRAVQSVGLKVHRTVQGWGPIWAHLVVLAEKP